MEKNFLKGHYLFEYHIEIVFNLIRDFKKLDEIFDDIRTPTKLLNGKNTYDIGNEFTYTVSGNRVIFSTISTKNEINLKSIKWRVKTDFLQYEYEYLLYRCSVDHSTLLEWKVSFSKPVKMDYDKALLEQSESFSKVHNLLKCDPCNYSLAESIVIKASRSSIINVLMKLGKISRNCDYCFGYVEYLGKPEKEQSKIFFKYPMLALDYKFVVEKAEFDNSKYIWTYSIKNICPLSKDSTELLQLTFNLFRIGDKKTLLQIKQIFNSVSINISEKVSRELLVIVKYIKSVVLDA